MLRIQTHSPGYAPHDASQADSVITLQMCHCDTHTDMQSYQGCLHDTLTNMLMHWLLTLSLAQWLMQLPQLPEPCRHGMHVAECMITVQQAAIEFNSGPFQLGTPTLSAHVAGSPTSTCAHLMPMSQQVTRFCATAWTQV